MSALVHYTECPVCRSSQINPLLTAKDYTASNEQFVIWQCNACTLRFTQDVPDETSIKGYYKAESYISHTNSNKGLVNRLYKKVRTRTLQQKKALIEETTGLQKGTLLDVGCGTGAFLDVMKQNGWKVTGLEPDEDARLLASELYGIAAEDPQALFNLPPASYNAITLWHVLEHVHRLHEYVEKLKTLLTPDGKLFIAVPNYTSVDAGIYGLNWAAYDVPRHLYHFTPAAMQTLMAQHGLKIVLKKCMWFDSFYVSLLSSKYRKGSTGYVSSVISGLRSNLKALGNTDRCSSVIYVISKA